RLGDSGRCGSPISPCVNDLAIELAPASNGTRLLDPVVSILDALRLRDQRHVMLACFLVMAGVAEYLAVLQRWLTAKAVRNVVVEMKLNAEQCATRFVLTILARTL